MNYCYIIHFVPFHFPEDERQALEGAYSAYIEKIREPHHTAVAQVGDFVVTQTELSAIASDLRELFGEKGYFCLIDRNDPSRIYCHPQRFGQQIADIPKIDMDNASLRIEELFQEA